MASRATAVAMATPGGKTSISQLRPLKKSDWIKMWNLIISKSVHGAVRVPVWKVFYQRSCSSSAAELPQFLRRPLHTNSFPQVIDLFVKGAKED